MLPRHGDLMSQVERRRCTTSALTFNQPELGKLFPTGNHSLHPMKARELPYSAAPRRVETDRGVGGGAGNTGEEMMALRFNMGVDGSQRIGATLTPRFGVASASGVNPALERRLVQRRRNWKVLLRMR
ncbi:unnamed protein product [Pleuronectes platessa]|uniref:Uncharacterized protein n=1 Tax=Pleuronectes platessa TaxID=8262 RepID=A0A9N7Z1A9_PLEPL|nr:unnamed protein product [Pleuronectes platessa]